jgi:MFS family permease
LPVHDLSAVNDYILRFKYSSTNAPIFSAVVPEIVSNEELPSASILSGLQLNISGIIGPALGGLLLVFVGASTVFALNALCLLAVLISIASWKPKVSKLPLESYFESGRFLSISKCFVDSGDAAIGA